MRNPLLFPLWAAFVALDRPPWLRAAAELLRRRGEPPECPVPPVRLELGRGKSGEPFLGQGWEGGIEHGRWSRGEEARVELRLPEHWVPSDLEIEINMVVGLWPEAPRRRVDVWANGHRVARWCFEGSELESRRERIVLPRRLLRRRRLSLVFHVPRPFAPPSQFAHFRIPRAFGICMGWIELAPRSG